MKNNEMLLASTLHDPHGVFLPKVEEAAEVVLNNYGGWIINTTTVTDQGIKDRLQQFTGVFVTETDPNLPIIDDKIENDHLYLLQQVIEIASKRGVRKIQYTDGDRIITAATHYPQDLQQMALRASMLTDNNLSYINFRRSVTGQNIGEAGDYFTHHPPLVVTEFEFNRLYTKAFRLPLDIGSTAHGMSLDVVEEISRKSPQMEPVSFPHPKWLIIAKSMGVEIRSEETHHVLTFETPDQYREQVRARINEARQRLNLPRITNLLSYEQEQQDFMATLGLENTVSSKEWNLRFNTATQYLNLLCNHLPVFRYDPETELKLKNEIIRSITYLAGLKTAFSKVLT